MRRTIGGWLVVGAAGAAILGVWVVLELVLRLVGEEATGFQVAPLPRSGNKYRDDGEGWRKHYQRAS